MGTTQPIRNKESIKKIEIYLKEKNYRDYLLFITCVNTALRISDVLRLKWKDVYDSVNNTVRNHIIIEEQKTKKQNTVALNASISDAVLSFRKLGNYNDGDYLFCSRKGKKMPITRFRAYKIFTDTAKALGIEQFSCHSLRKTFGYHAWKQQFPPVILMEIYNHSSFAITKKYLGITQDEKDNVYNLNIL